MDDFQYDPNEFRSPAEAVKILGVSPKTIQLWVENGTLRAWKTAGGHRRITTESIMEVVRKRDQAKKPPVSLTVAVAEEATTPGILVVEDEANLRRLYELSLASWGLPLRIDTAKDGFEGLLKVGKQRPSVLITDLHMPGIDGFQMIRRLKDMPELSNMLLLVVTAMNTIEIEAQGGLPEDLLVFNKPIPFDKLKEHITTYLGLTEQTARIAL